MLLGGRGAGSEKILPICARAGSGASNTVVAITRATGPVRAMARNISCGFNGRIGNGRIGPLTIVQGYIVYPPLAGQPVNTPNTAGERRFADPSRPQRQKEKITPSPHSRPRPP